MAELATMETLCKQVYNSTVQQQRLNEKTVVTTTDATVRSASKDAESNGNDLTLLATKDYKNPEWLRMAYWQFNLSCTEIARLVGLETGAAICHYMKKLGIPRRKAGGPAGNKSGLWKGGRSLQPNGYVWVSAPGHPRVRKSYVAEHILVAERLLGRYLHKGESVHHINGIKNDNRPENLMVFASEKEHQQHEDRFNRFAKQLLFGELANHLKDELVKLFQQVK